jgi:predicted enzyme related to lactoylglutathione lyase
MTGRWSAVTVDCVHPARVAEFWAALLGLEPTEALPGWARLRHPAAPSAPLLTFQPVPEPKQGKVRLHLDVAVDDIDEGIATVRRLGGRSLGQRHDYDEGVVVVMADPEDHEFCLVQYYG